MARQDMDLSVEEIIGIVDQASAIGIESIHPHLFGEPTNHPFYSDVLYSIRQRHPRLSIIQYTNGQTLHKEDILAAILDNVDTLVISIDGATNSTMVEARPGIDPDKIRFGVKRLYSARSQSKPLITIRMTEMPLNSHEIHLYKTTWQPFCDHIQIAYLQNFRGSKLFNCKIRSALPCDRVFHSIVVTANQNVVLCCDDFKEDMILGNLRDMPLRDIWFGARAKSIRRLHLLGNSNQIPMCGDCTYLGFL
jgi:radical SAM protein with 4Fe4S-binding SPASM domain